MRPRFLLLLVLFNVLWAGTLSAYKTLEPYLSYSGIVTLRFGTAALGLLLVWPILPGKTPRGRDLLITSLMGVIVFVLGHRLQALGNSLGSAGNSSVLMGTEPLITSVAAAIFLREHVALRRWVGFALGMAGVALLNGAGQAGLRWIGFGVSLIFVSSFLCETAYSIIGKPLIERASLFKVAAVSLTAGTIANLLLDGPTTIAAARQLPPIAWLTFLYLGVLCTSVGYCVWYIVIRETDVNLAALTIFVQPLAGVVIASVVLKEELHAGQLWGGAAIIGGLLVGFFRSQSSGRAGPPRSDFAEAR
jgi:drug/metabolite transporter (DMT)-like permease